jgi:hypothetical protein
VTVLWTKDVRVIVYRWISRESLLRLAREEEPEGFSEVMGHLTKSIPALYCSDNVHVTTGVMLLSEYSTWNLTQIFSV